MFVYTIKYTKIIFDTFFNVNYQIIHYYTFVVFRKFFKNRFNVEKSNVLLFVLYFKVYY